MTLELKDISTSSGGTFSTSAFGTVARPKIVTPVENALRGMAKLHNAMHGAKPGCRANVSALRAVYRRGAAAYKPSRHPAVGRRRWAMRRVKAHMQLLASGQRPHPRYKNDDDLLPAGHPLAATTIAGRKALLAVEGHPERPAPPSRSAADLLAGLAHKTATDALDRLEVKAAWSPDKHPRDHRGRFIHIGGAVNALIDGKSQAGTVMSTRGQSVRVRTADGAEHTVAASATEVTDHVGEHQSLPELAHAHTDAERKAKQLAKANHPEAGAWAERQAALGDAIKTRTKAGESIHEPYAPQAAQEDLATPGGLHKHLTGGAHGDAAVPPFGPDDQAAHEQMHARAHALGADHSHAPPAAASAVPDPGWGKPYGSDGGPSYVTGDGTPVFMFRKGQAVRFYDGSGQQVGPDQTNVAPAVAYAHSQGWAPPPVAGDHALPGEADTRPDGSDWGSGYAPGDPRSDPAYDKYVANLDAQTETALADYGDTKDRHDHIDGVPGAYTAERQAQHDAIVDELLGSYKTMPRERKAVMLAGPPGAGKSTVIKQLGHQFGVESDDKGNPTNYATVNPDNIKEMMIARGMVDPVYASYGLGPQETATLIHEESSNIAKALHRALLAHGTNTIVDGTFSGPIDKNVGKINDLRASGYTVTGVLVDGDIERSLINAGARHRKNQQTNELDIPDLTIGGTRLQGRYVPIRHIEAQRPTGQWSDIMDRPHQSQNAENFEAAKDVFNGGIRIFDNSAGVQKLLYSEEPEPGGTPRVEPLGDKHLEKLATGTVGQVSNHDLPGVIALGLRKATETGRPHYVQAGPTGYGAHPAPVSRDYVHVTPAGHVTQVQRDPATGQITRTPMPRPDVEKLVDHYVKPAKDGGGSPRA